ncbi:MAG: NTP transferase domain-containing protein [Steroidobacteraceae bacterium]
MKSANVYGLVLSGGASRRMQHDKAALPYQDVPQLQRACELLATCCTRVFVSARADQQQDELRKRWPLIVDQQQELGPLAGIAAAQAAHSDVAWLVIACDLPLLNPQTLQRLLQQRDATHIAIAFRDAEQQPEPLCALWEPTSASLVRNAIAAGQYSPRRLLQSCATLLVDPLDPATLSNVNTTDEYRQANTTLNSMLTLQLQYFAIFREQAGKRSESWSTQATTPAEIYAELQQRYGFKLNREQLKVAVNNEFCEWQQPLKSGDSIAFIPPVAGG